MPCAGSGGKALLGWLTRKHKAPEGLLGLETGPEGIALALVRREADGRPELVRCLFEAAEPAAQEAALRKLVEEHGLRGAEVNLVLHPADYQLLLLDCPDVPEEELRDAMRWRLKDLINQPLESQVTDLIPLPADAYRGRSRMAYCAVLDKSRMEAAARLVRQAGLRLRSIDITEMAFRNLGLLAGAEGINLALLRLRSSEGLVSVQNGDELYMARRIEQGIEHAGDNYAAVTLEVQRSLDYFESQLGKGYISRLLLLPMKRDGAQALQALGAGLAVKLQALTLEELFGERMPLLDEREQAYCIAAVGAALRQEAG